MFKRYLLVSLTALSAQQIVAHSLQDRIMGAILGSTVGDALARATDLDTIYEIEAIYPGGVTSFKNFTQLDWVTDPSGKKLAASTASTVLASLVIEVCSEGRRLNQSKEAITDMIARRLVDLFGPHAKKLDPLFDARGYTHKQIEDGKLLGRLLETNPGDRWWKQLPVDADSKFHPDIAEEGDSGALMRAWPFGVVFADNLKMAKETAESVTTITHRHPAAQAAAAAMVTGIVYALQASPVEDILNNMARAAEAYDSKERLYKPGVKKIRTRKGYTAEVISQGKMFTSDMIRYAALKAKEGHSPVEILGDTNKRQDNHRSYRGYLLGTEADEAVAAAVYILARHPNDLKAALVEAVNMPGNSALVASLVGALVGARTGLDQLQKDFAYELTVLENGLEQGLLLDSAGELADSIRRSPVAPTTEETISAPRSYRNWILGGTCIGAVVAGWAIYNYFFAQP